MSKKNTLLLILLNIALAYTLHAQFLDRPDVITLSASLKKQVPDSTRVVTLLELSRYYLICSVVPNHIDSATYYLNQAEKYPMGVNSWARDSAELLSLSIKDNSTKDQIPASSYLLLVEKFRSYGDKANEALAYYELANSLPKVERYDSLIALSFRRASELALELNAHEASLQWKTGLAAAHIRQHKLDIAEQELFSVIKNPNANNYIALAASDRLSQLYHTKGLYDKALYYALRCERLMEITGDSIMAVNYYSRLASTYAALNKQEECIYWSKRALEHCLATKKYQFVYDISSSVVRSYIELGKTKEAIDFMNYVFNRYKPTTPDDKELYNQTLGDIYKVEKNYRMAERYYLEMYRLGNLKSPRDVLPIDRALNNQTLGKLYLAMGQYKKAKLYIDRALIDGELDGSLALLNRLHLTAFKVDSALGMYQSAIVHLQIAHKLNDSAYKKESVKRFEELQVSYQSEKKEKDIAILKGHEKQQRIQLLHSENTKNITIVTSVLLIVIVAMLFWQNKVRRKKNNIILEKNDHLQQLISEKDWLLKEVHHRVKNNLHTVICLLESQANYLESDALKAIETSQHRIYAMSLIHQKLYQSDDIKTIDIKDYIGELINYLKDSFGTNENIEIHCSITSIKIGVNHAIPIGLIINEAVTNAMQHAFPGNIDGKIQIQLMKAGDEITLIIEDDGIGFDIGKAETESLGIELIKGLTKELKGTVLFRSVDGTEIIIAFSLDPLEKMLLQNPAKESAT